jgi:hypothetical protein
VTYLTLKSTPTLTSNAMNGYDELIMIYDNEDEIIIIIIIIIVRWMHKHEE